jgi:hypothetical protein
MADVLPMIPNTVPQVRAPESRVSPSDIAQPRLLLAQNLARAGEVIEKDVAEPFAEKAGHEAVSTDPNGNLIVDRTPIFGPASITFKKAAMETALSQTLPKVDSDLNDLKNQFPNDPAGFSIAQKEYTAETVKNLPPELRPSVAAHAINSGEHNYRALTNQAAQTNLTTFLETQKATLVGLREDMTSLARQGGTDTPEYKQKFGEMLSVYKSLGDDPRVLYPLARAQQEISDHRDEDVSQAILGNVLRTYQTKANAIEAQRALRDAFDNPDLKLSQQKRDKGVTDGLKLLERTSVEDKFEVTQFRSALTTYTDNILKRPDTFTDVAHNELKQRASALGDFRSMALLDQVKAFLPVVQTLKTMTVPQQNEFFREASKNIIPALPVRLRDAGLQGAIEQEAQRQGISPQLAVTVAQIESGGNPRAVTGSYKGIYQLSDEGFRKFGGGGDIFDPAANVRAGIASLKADAAAFEQKFGRQPTPTELYLSHQQGQGGIAAHLQNPDAPAYQNMLSTAEGQQKGEGWAKQAIWGNVPDRVKALFPGGVESLTSRQFMDIWTQRVQGIPYAGTGLTAGQTVGSISNAYAQKLWETTLKHMGETAGHSATRAAAQIQEQAKAGVRPTDEDIETFVTSANLSGKTELIEPVKTALTAFDAAQQFVGKPGAVAALESQIAAMEGTAEGVSTLQYHALKQAQTIVEQNTKEWAESPLIAGSRAQTIKPVHPLPLDNPAAATAEFADRQSKIQLLQMPAGHNVGAINVLADKNEREGVKTALTQGDPKAAAGILAGMQQTLKPDIFRATMASDEMKQALGGMIRSHDPTRMTAGFETLDKLERMDASGFGRQFAGDYELLQAWQALRTFYPPDKIAERLNQANDPAQIKMLADSRKLGETEAKAWKPDQLARLVAGSWNILPGQPTAPAAVVGVGNIADEMAHDFATIYTGLRTYGVPEGSWYDSIAGNKNAKTLAAERLQQKWSVSQVAGNQVMAYPPDLVSRDKDTGASKGAFYPMINGSFDWMKTDVLAAITSAKGPETTVGPGEVLGGGVSTNWRYKGLISDAQTQAEISAGKPPSYRIVVDSGDGLNQILVDPKTGRDRITFDPTSHIAQTTERARAVNRLSQPLTQEQILGQGQFLSNVRGSVGR